MWEAKAAKEAAKKEGRGRRCKAQKNAQNKKTTRHRVGHRRLHQQAAEVGGLVGRVAEELDELGAPQVEHELRVDGKV